MPCSSLLMSLRPTTSLFHLSPKTLLKSSLFSLLLSRNQCLSFRSFPQLRRYGAVTCSGAATRARRLNWKNVSWPYLEQQCSNYGRFAYLDVSSDESDREFGSKQQQMVNYAFFIELANLNWVFFSFMWQFLLVIQALRLRLDKVALLRQYMSLW